MAENKTEHMFNIANFLSQNFPHQQQQYISPFTADGYCVENKNFSSHECCGEEITLRANFSSSGKQA